MTDKQKHEYFLQVVEGIKQCGISRENEKHMISHHEDEEDLITEVYASERKALYTIKYDTFDRYLSIDVRHVGHEGMKIMLNAIMDDGQHATDNVALLVKIVI